MIGRLFVAICNLRPLRKLLWHAWYGFLAGQYRSPDWTFMNYGYLEASGPKLRLEPQDESDRYCIQLYNRVAAAIDLAGKNVLEVGSGRGGGASFIARYLRPAKMTGVDLSQNAADFSVRRHRVDGLEFRRGDAERLPFSPASFDAVLNVESSHCYPSIETFLREVHRVLKPGGYFLYADFRQASNLEEWRRTILQSGLKLIREDDITGEVLTALDRDNERKTQLIHKIVPRVLKQSVSDFAALRGSAVYEGFRHRTLVYLCFVLQK